MSVESEGLLKGVEKKPLPFRSGLDYAPGIIRNCRGQFRVHWVGVGAVG